MMIRVVCVIGNVLDPLEIVNKYGTDVLRCENNVLRFGLTLNKAIISASVGRPPSVGRRCCCRNRRHRGGCSWVRLAVEVV